MPENGAPTSVVIGDGTPAYFTPDEVAELLRVSEKTVSRWAAKDPTLPVLRIGGTVRFPRERLLRWLHAREQGQRTSNPMRSVRNPASAKATG